MYSRTVLEHFRHPRNTGKLDPCDGHSHVVSEVCSDTVDLFIRVAGGVVEEASFLCQGCAAAIASTSVLTVMIKGQPVEEVRKITKETLVKALGGLPPHKVACSLIAPQALKEALEQAAKARQ